MDDEIKNKIHDAAKTFAFNAIVDSHNHQDAVLEFEEGFTQGAEWLIENLNLISNMNLVEAMGIEDEAIENHAQSLFCKCETNEFSEEEKLVLLNSFKYPFEEGIDWAYDNFLI